ncbi:MAG: ABC transporter permease [Treponema sp.]|jgi:simple sugar transport system permease protein|nr:ABC transporter permease [Treponema sp.]
MWDFIQQIAPYAIAYTVPIFVTALGGCISERSGIINIGLEGLMVVGSFIGGICVYYLGPHIGYGTAAWIGVLLGMAGGVLFSVLHAFACINLSADQTISGIAVNMVTGALVLFCSRGITGTATLVINSMIRVDVPLLNRIPVAGRLLFTDTYTTTWLITILLAGVWFLIEKTPFGLRLRACGEYPEAAAAVGIRVAHIRYIGVLFSGALAGIGGAVYTVTIAGQSSGSVGGLGFLAIAGVIFGQWRVFRILFATLFFGFSVTIAQISMLLPVMTGIHPLILKIFPYAITLLVLVVFSKSSHAPAAEGKIFDYKKG